jgi:predicted aldo/keto reductase-like oxidoreductase
LDLKRPPLAVPGSLQQRFNFDPGSQLQRVLYRLRFPPVKVPFALPPKRPRPCLAHNCPRFRAENSPSVFLVYSGANQSVILESDLKIALHAAPQLSIDLRPLFSSVQVAAPDTRSDRLPGGCRLK